MLWNSSLSQRKSEFISISYFLPWLIHRNSHKRLTQQKKQRERERKELDNMGRRHLANYRVVQRNVVYVVGIGPMFAKEEVRHMFFVLIY